MIHVHFNFVEMLATNSMEHIVSLLFPNKPMLWFLFWILDLSCVQNWHWHISICLFNVLSITNNDLIVQFVHFTEDYAMKMWKQLRCHDVTCTYIVYWWISQCGYNCFVMIYIIWYTYMYIKLLVHGLTYCDDMAEHLILIPLILHGAFCGSCSSCQPYYYII